MRSSRVSRRVFALLLLLLLGASSAAAVTLKVASAAPESSPWGEALNRIASEWAEISGGEVTLQVFHNSIAGEEVDVVRKMRVGQIDAGIFTTVGLAEIASEIKTISAPFLIRSNEEFDYVFERMQDSFAEAVERRRFQVLGWSKAGWVRFFANEAIRTPEDLMEITLGGSGSDPELLRAFRVMGFRITPVGTTEVLTALNSGMIDAIYASPISAAGFQWFSQAQNMLNVRVAPFIGGFVATQRAWRRVPDAIKPELLEAVDEMVARLDRDVLSLEQEAVDTMESYGLNVIEPSESQREEWFNILDANRDELVGEVFPEEEFRMIEGHLQSVRR